jgi:putative transposase
VSQTLPTASTRFICRVLGVARSALYRQHQALPTAQPTPDAILVARINELIAQHPTFGYRRIWARLRFGDQLLINKKKVHRILRQHGWMVHARVATPRTIYYTLLAEGRVLCHWRTMYRLLRADNASRERRAIRRHPTYTKPELLATKPCEVWSWDITLLRGPRPGLWYRLYVVVDIFSRKVVGWLVAEHEHAELAEHLLADACDREGIMPQQLTVHADRGAVMTSKTVADMLLDLGVERSHSRPSVSNDNPYSESQFKTMKYGPTYPDRFASLDYAWPLVRFSVR